MIVKTDIEIWLLFAPFWILGLGALIGGLYHLAHGWKAHPEHHAKRRHHYSRAVIAMAAFLILMIIGIGVAAAVGYVIEN